MGSIDTTLKKWQRCSIFTPVEGKIYSSVWSHVNLIPPYSYRQFHSNAMLPYPIKAQSFSADTRSSANWLDKLSCFLLYYQRCLWTHAASLESWAYLSVCSGHQSSFNSHSSFWWKFRVSQCTGGSWRGCQLVWRPLMDTPSIKLQGKHGFLCWYLVVQCFIPFLWYHHHHFIPIYSQPWNVCDIRWFGTYSNWSKWDCRCAMVREGEPLSRCKDTDEMGAVTRWRVLEERQTRGDWSGKLLVPPCYLYSSHFL